jgi:diguanylate cyclase (GGDEF)-like protein
MPAKVLVVDDNDGIRHALVELLSTHPDLEVVGDAPDGESAIRLAQELSPDVVLMDVKMPGMDGIEATRRIRQIDPNVQIVAHTAYEDATLVSDMVKAGAKSYLLKGAEAESITNALTSVLDGRSVLDEATTRPVLDEIEVLYQKEQERTRELEALVRQLQELTVTDYLTGLYSHRFFHDRLEEELARAQRYRRPLSLMILDLDDFKLVNERFGYSVGDQVLKELASRLRSECRSIDIACRIGGEEVAIILPETYSTAAGHLAERLRQRVSSESFEAAGNLTCSIGVAGYPTDAATRDDLLTRANMALARAKSLGKDTVVVYKPAWTEEIQDGSERIRREFLLRSVFALAAAVDARDRYTAQHSQRLAEYSQLIASEIGFSRAELESLRLSALLHDVGKIGIRDAVLLKPGRLTDDEFAEMKLHPDIGHKILQGAVDGQILSVVRHHHERFDGTGYPDGLARDEIPLGARCLLVADAFDAMTSHRVYRKALPMERVVDELRRHSGTQFDPEIVKVFLGLLEDGKLAPFYKGNTELSIEALA